jgi:hypothetical protein
MLEGDSRYSSSIFGPRTATSDVKKTLLSPDTTKHRISDNQSPALQNGVEGGGTHSGGLSARSGLVYTVFIFIFRLLRLLRLLRLSRLSRRIFGVGFSFIVLPRTGRT